MTEDQHLRLLFWAETAEEAEQQARRWVENEPRLELVEYISTEPHENGAARWLCLVLVRDTGLAGRLP